MAASFPFFDEFLCLIPGCSASRVQPGREGGGGIPNVEFACQQSIYFSDDESSQIETETFFPGQQLVFFGPWAAKVQHGFPKQSSVQFLIMNPHTRSIVALDEGFAWQKG
jgi:hypothetical protein